MIDKNLMRNRFDFLRAMDKGQYERTATGLFFPFAGSEVRGEFTIEGDKHSPNLQTEAGLAHLLEVGVADAEGNPNWFIALYGADYTPTPAITAAQFPTLATEITSPTNGYSEGTRQAWVVPENATKSGGNASISNADNRAQFSIVTPSESELLIYGAALLPSNVKGSTDGPLLSITRFPGAPEKRRNGTTLLIEYRISLVQP